MGLLRLTAALLLLGSPALAQTYGVGRAPSPDEIRAMDISIGPTGEELPPGRGSAKEGATLFQAKGCAGCHGKAGVGAMAPALQSNKAQDLPLWERGRGSSGWMILPLTAPNATIVWDYIHRGMPLGREGTLSADEVYALTAYHRMLCAERGSPVSADTPALELAHELMRLVEEHARDPRGACIQVLV